MAETVPTAPLKRLGFVHNAASYAHSWTVTGDNIYRRVRQIVPSAVQPHLAKVEEVVASYAVPAVNRAQDAGEKILYFADDKVDYLYNTADGVLNASKDKVRDTGSNAKKLHETNMSQLKGASNWYWDQVAQLTHWATEKLNPIKGGQAALAALNAGIANAKAATDPDVAVQLASDAWAKFASVPIVAKVLETADPATTKVIKSLYSLHDNVVSWPLYKKAYDTGASTLGWATHTTPYKLGAQYLYPIVQPVADPAIDKVTGSKVIKSTWEYWTPTAAA